VAVRSSAGWTGWTSGAGGAFSSTGESGGGGMSVPSVREKETGVRAGRVNRPLGLPFAGMISFLDCQLRTVLVELRMRKPSRRSK
jgi:hypothetical protein